VPAGGRENCPLVRSDIAGQAHVMSWRHCVQALLAVLAVVNASCAPSADTDRLTIRNRTYERLTVSLLGLEPGSETNPGEVPTINTGSIHIGGPGCRGSGVVAVNGQGREVARHDQAPCGGDEWIIERDGTARYVPAAERR